jgi:hypothetical protein
VADGAGAAAWAIAVPILLLSLVAMQFTLSVNWDVVDFAVAGVLLIGIGFMYELAARMAGNIAYQAAVGVALAQTLVVVIALIAGLDSPLSEPLEILIGNGIFVALFVGSALLFREAMPGGPERGAI